MLTLHIIKRALRSHLRLTLPQRERARTRLLYRLLCKVT